MFNFYSVLTALLFTSMLSAAPTIYPITVYSDLPAGPIEQAIQFWNDEKGLEVLRFGGPTQGRTVHVIRFVDGEDFKWGADKLAVMYGQSVLLNGYYRNHLDSKWKPDADKYHLQSLLVHELGHLLGDLNHTVSGPMAAQLAPGKVYFYNVEDPNLAQFIGPRELKREALNMLNHLHGN